jgi:hypothetical protein
MTEPYSALGGQPRMRGKLKGKRPDWDHGCIHTPDPHGNYLDSEDRPTGRYCPCRYETPDETREK